MSHTVFGIRHHGPGSARTLERALAQLEPDAILIEGPPDADHLLPAVLESRRHQADVAHEVEARELVELGLGQPPLGVEEPVVDGASAQALEVVDEPLSVVRRNAPNANRAAVLQEFVGGIRRGSRHGAE